MVHDGDSVAHRERFLLIVRHENGRNSKPLLQLPELELHALAKVLVECAEGLVEEQHGRARDERPCKRDSLLLPARELGGERSWKPGSRTSESASFTLGGISERGTLAILRPKAMFSATVIWGKRL